MRAPRGPRIGKVPVLRVVKYLVLLVIAWLVLSAVLFFVSAEDHAGNLPKGLQASLTSSGGPMLFSAQTVLVLGLDNRPTSGSGSKEPGSNYNELDANTDSIMLWRIGGGVSRRLSIPRDTLVNVPGLGQSKINAAWSQSPATTVKVVEQLTGIKINHVIIVDLSNFSKFIDDIGGVTVHNTVPICSELAGGAGEGGFTLNLKPGTHHLTGLQALTYARVRDDSCDAAYTDIQREAAQQEILNGIKSQLFSFHAFTHLPWASWDAPGVIQTDMGGITLAELFVSSEIGGSPKPMLLSETADNNDGDLGDVLIPNAANVRTQVNKLMNG
jgi:LCP family protein required for cell wall assembly